MGESSKIFALDIGTRSVVGIILKEDNGRFEIVDIVINEHKERSMIDGQIHDILSVSNVIYETKKILEERHGKLEKVCVAAAGRALKTERAKATLNISGKPIMKKEDILHLELSAVQQAQYSIAEKQNDENSHHYYCVGYSVIHYQLDNQDIGSLIDQQGEEASVEVIATFLPKVVVESLIAALHRAELEMEALTLEPIAAINVLIPQSMRRLNVALVDIGAGTSDIAITDLGTIVAYGMVPVAGDEITEAISDQFLLDFPLAEKAKRDLYTNEAIKVTDILGFENEISKDQVVTQISESIDKLASHIREEILHLNNSKPPKAVMLVGGGSLTPELPKRLATMLGLPENRVAIRGIDAIQNIELAESVNKGPELVTPIGIAIAARQSPVQYLSVYVNDKPVRLFDMKQLTVGDCLLAAGIKMSKLYGKPGMAMIISINGQQVTIPGKHGTPPSIALNGQVCSLDDRVQNGDTLLVQKGEDGSSVSIMIKDLIDEVPSKYIFINGIKYTLQAKISQNSRLVTSDTFVQDRDTISYYFPDTFSDALIELNIEDELTKLTRFTIQLNDESVHVPECSYRLMKNNMETSPSTTFINGDTFEFVQGQPSTVKNVLESLDKKMTEHISVFYHDEQIEMHKPILELYRNGQLLKQDDLLSMDDKVQVVSKKIEPFIFQDLFRHVDIQLPSRNAGRFVLLKNNEEVSFHEPINTGDHLKIVWPEKITN
ncbi:cell division protein FtsA [Bacillus timonensis]|nr:cell division protein FtsA [Bacillus timonensis]